MRKKNAHGGLTLAALTVALSCSGCIQGTTDPADVASLVELTFQGLRPLGEGLKYQAWAVTRRGGVFQGVPFLVFDVSPSGALVDPVQDTVLTGPFLVRLATRDIEGVALSLELTQGEFTTSSYSYLLGGEVEGKIAQLEPASWMGLDMDLAGMTGGYMLETPTGGDGEGDLSGIWFLDRSGGTPVPGLDLPEAVAGWTYEGWVVVGTDTLSTGKFSTPTGADASNRFCGEDPAPPFPGEDFLVDPPAGVSFPLNLPGAEVFVTLEPWGTWDLEPQSPVFLRLLEGEIPHSAVSGESYGLSSLFNQLPRGTARVRKP